MYFDIGEFPSCCGMVIAHDFGGGDNQMSNLLKERGNKPVCAITSAVQKDAEKALTTTGFQPLFKFKNPRSGSLLTFWLLSKDTPAFELLAPMLPIDRDFVADVVRGVVYDSLTASLSIQPKPRRKLRPRAAAKEEPQR
jgi:hypothetical protein